MNFERQAQIEWVMLYRLVPNANRPLVLCEYNAGRAEVWGPVGFLALDAVIPLFVALPRAYDFGYIQLFRLADLPEATDFILGKGSRAGSPGTSL